MGKYVLSSYVLNSARNSTNCSHWIDAAAILKIAASSFIYFRNNSFSVHTTVITARKAIRYKTQLFQYRSGAPTQKLCRNRRFVCEQKVRIRHGLPGTDTKAIRYRHLAHDVKTVDLEDNFKVPTFNRANNQ